MRFFQDNGIIRRIQPLDSATRYETRVGDNHHHFVCRSCGYVVDLDCAVGDPLCVSPGEDPQFEVHEVEVMYRGYCRECRNDERPNSPKEKR